MHQSLVPKYFSPHSPSLLLLPPPLPEMVSRTGSIFHIEEEGERDNEIGDGAFAAETGGLVGLQILIKHGGIDSKVLIKPSMKKNKPVEHFLGDFLESCFSCSKELSLQKEVYMYRGDQGFCSVECRYKQILEDERKELDSSRRLRFMAVPNNPQHKRSKIQESGRRSKISASA